MQYPILTGIILLSGVKNYILKHLISSEKMSDTPDEILRKQIEILLSKSEEERFRIGDELASFGRKVLDSSIRHENPGISEIDLKTEIFKRCYSMYYSPEEMNLIIESMRAFLLSST